MRKVLLVQALTAFLFVPAIVFAYANPGAPRGFVNDFANLLTPTDRQALEAKLSTFEKESSHEITIATVQTLGGDTIENFAVKLFEDWKIGKAKADNGVLILVAADEHAVRIEVGYGLEGALTDAQSYWIIQNQIIPAFQDGNYYVGLNDATDKIIAATKGEVIPTTSETQSSGFGGGIGNIVLFGFFILTWITSILARSRSWWAGGVIGGVCGVVLGILFGFAWIGIISIAILIPLGLLFDYEVSKAYERGKVGGRIPWWAGGRGFGGGGGGFGGFGGGRSGGGGASGKW